MIIEFSYSELESATNKFSDSNLIGVGGSSHVYRGHLKNGKVVAVKRMKIQAGADAEFTFLTEVIPQTANIILLINGKERHGAYEVIGGRANMYIQIIKFLTSFCADRTDIKTSSLSCDPFAWLLLRTARKTCREAVSI